MTPALRLWILFALAVLRGWAGSAFTPWAVDLAPRLWLYDVLFYARVLLLFWAACEVLRVLLRRDRRAAVLVPLALVLATGAFAYAYAQGEGGWRGKVAASRDALQSSAHDGDRRHRAGHFIVDTVRHPCRDDQPWLWLGRPHGAGSGTNLALVHSGVSAPQTPMLEAFAFWPVRDGWWLAYQHAARYQHTMATGGSQRCQPGRVVARHRDGQAFLRAGSD